MRTLHVIALILVIVGAVKWGLVGLAQFDLVVTLFGGQGTPVARIVYSLIGIAGLALGATSLSRGHARCTARLPSLSDEGLNSP